MDILHGSRLRRTLRRGIPVLTLVVQVAAAVITAVGLLGCGGHGHSQAAASASAQRSQARQVIAQATANPTVQAAITKAKKDVVNPCITASTGPVSFKNCVYAHVPQAQRAQVRHCVEKALLGDHISTYAGKAKWLDTDVPACVGAVLP